MSSSSSSEQPANETANAIITIIDRFKPGDCPWGVYYFCGNPAVSWYQFAEQIIKTALEIGLPLKVKNLEAIPNSAFPLPAKRAANSRIDCHKFERIFALPTPHGKKGCTWLPWIYGLLKIKFPGLNATSPHIFASCNKGI